MIGTCKYCIYRDRIKECEKIKNVLSIEVTCRDYLHNRKDLFIYVPDNFYCSEFELRPDLEDSK